MDSTSNRLYEALDFAARAHAGQVRKGTDTPYITHPVGVAWILWAAGAEEALVVAGLLHDVTEDGGVTTTVLREHFGDRVAGLVDACSEPDKNLPWIERKEHSIRSLSEAGDDARAVTAADKLHNARSLLTDFREIGHDLWSRFRQGPHHQAWYYGSVGHTILATARSDLVRGIATQLLRTLDELFAPDFETRWQVHPGCARCVRVSRDVAKEKRSARDAGEAWLLAIDPETHDARWVKHDADGLVDGAKGHEDLFPAEMLFTHPDGFLPGGDWVAARTRGEQRHDGVYRSYFVRWA